jgi:hypothetical protein
MMMKSYDTFLSSSNVIILFMFSPFLQFTHQHRFRLFSVSAAALKTQPYDLLRWSAAYFRCLSLDVLPPVKPRYEHENVFGCLTKGYLKVLLSQVSQVLGDRVEGLVSCFIRFMLPYNRNAV